MRRQLATGLAASCLFLGVAAAQAGWQEGVEAFQRGDYMVAAQEFQVIADQQPSWPGGHLMLGRTLLKLNRPEDAALYLQRAYELNPADLPSALTLSRTLLDLNRPADALTVLGQVAVADASRENQVVFHQLRAQARLRGDQPQDALPDLARAAELSPDNASLQLLYGSHELKYGQLERALPALAAAARLAPDDGDTHRTYLQALLEQARASDVGARAAAYGQVAAAVRQLVEREASYDNLLLLASAEYNAGQLEQAFHTYGRAAELQPTEAQPHVSRGQVRLAQNRFADAEVELRRAVELTPPEGQKRLWGQLGLVYENLPAPDFFDEAKDAYRQAGDTIALARVEENERIHRENRDLDAAATRLARERACRQEITRILDTGGIPPSMEACIAAKG